MLDFMMNNKEYEFGSDSNLAAILTQFDSSYLMHVISDTLEMQFNSFDTLPKPNAVNAYKMVFNELYDQYDADREQIYVTEYNTYRDVIEIIGRKYGFQFTEIENLDMYSMAYYVYDFFVSRFNQYLVSFYSRYLDEQKESIVGSMNKEELMSNKDMSTNYGKISFGANNPMVMITANLPIVLANLRVMDIPDVVVYRYAYGSNEAIANLLQYHISPNSTIFNIYNNLLFNPFLSTTIMTQIRLKIQQDHAEIFDPKGVGL